MESDLPRKKTPLFCYVYIFSTISLKIKMYKYKISKKFIFSYYYFILIEETTIKNKKNFKNHVDKTF